MKNILINTTPLLSTHTGIARYIYNLALALQKEYSDNCYHYYEGYAWTDVLRDTPSKKVASFKNKFVKKVPYSRFIIQKLQKNLFEHRFNTDDVGIYHEPNYLPVSYKYKTIITMHDLSFIRYPEAHPFERVDLLEKKLPEAIDRSGAILVDSHFVKNEVIDCFNVDPSKIIVHHLAVDDVYYPRLEQQTSNTLNKYGLGYKKFLLSVGTLEPRKNLAQTIAAFRQLPDSVQAEYPLVIVGAKGWGDSPFNDEIGRLVDKGHIIIPGYVDIQSLAELYSAAKIFLYPSIYEGFGLPPLEAMTSGVPVIVSDVASLPEVVGEAGIKIEVGDADRMASEIKSLISDEQHYENVCKLSLEQSEIFTWKKCADVTMSAYKQVMEL